MVKATAVDVVIVRTMAVVVIVSMVFMATLGLLLTAPIDISTERVVALPKPLHVVNLCVLKIFPLWSL